MARYDTYAQLDDTEIEEVDTNFKGYNNRSRPDSLPDGFFSDSRNFRFDLEGIAQPRNSIIVKSAPLTLDSNTAFTLPFYAYGTKTTSAIGLSGTTITLTFSSAHEINDDTLIYVNSIAGITGFVAGNYKANVTSSTVLEITVAGIGGSPSTSTVNIGAPAVQDAFTTKVYGSCVFADPKNAGEEYIIIAGNANAFAIKVSDSTTTSIAYPSDIQLSEDANMIQALNRVYIFRKGKTALEWNQTLTGSPAFTKVANGTFTQPVLLDSSNNTTVLNGKVSVAETGHGLETGNTIVIVDGGHAGLNDGDEYRVTKVDADNFYFYVDGVDDDTSGHSSKYIAKLPSGGGYIHMPAPEFGVLHKERLVVPYVYTSDSSPAQRDPAILDEVLFSEGFFPDQYDPTFGLFRLFAGRADKVIGMFSFAEDKLVVFMRKSIHVISNTVSLNSALKEHITDEVGLVARRSVVQVGNQILFLSDNGVYGLSFIDLYNLRGNDLPLSETINATIENINKDHWDKSVGVYFNNRYYLAVPYEDSEVNNRILVYNFLNKAWESEDTVGSTALDGSSVNWDIQNLLVAGEGNDRGVYAINSLGGSHRIDASSASNEDQLITSIGGSTQQVSILSNITTRDVNFRTADRKKFRSFELQVESNDSLVSDIDIRFRTKNEDGVVRAGNLRDFNGNEDLARSEDISIRGRIASLRAYSIATQLRVVTGKPKIKLIKIKGTNAYRSEQKAI